MRSFLLRRRWLVAHAFVLVTVPVCIRLGLWQLERLEERRAHNALVARRGTFSPQPLAAVGDPGAAAYRRVEERGRYDPAREVILLGRSLNGRPGNHVLTPLVTAAGTALVVDRGWVPSETGRPPAPGARPPEGPVRVAGVLLPTEGRGPFARTAPPGAVTTLSRADVERLAAQLPYPVYPLYLRLEGQDPPQPGELPLPAPMPPLDEGPHLGYAVQWFLFGTIALVVYGANLRKEVRELRRQALHSPAPGEEQGG